MPNPFSLTPGVPRPAPFPALPPERASAAQDQQQIPVGQTSAHLHAVAPHPPLPLRPFHGAEATRRMLQGASRGAARSEAAASEVKKAEGLPRILGGKLVSRLSDEEFKYQVQKLQDNGKLTALMQAEIKEEWKLRKMAPPQLQRAMLMAKAAVDSSAWPRSAINLRRFINIRNHFERMSGMSKPTVPGEAVNPFISVRRSQELMAALPGIESANRKMIRGTTPGSETDGSMGRTALFTPGRDFVRHPPTLRELGLTELISRHFPATNLNTDLHVDPRLRTLFSRLIPNLLHELKETMTKPYVPYFVVCVSGSTDRSRDRSIVFSGQEGDASGFQIFTDHPSPVAPGSLDALEHFLKRHVQGRLAAPILIMTPIVPYLPGDTPEQQTRGSLRHIGYYAPVKHQLPPDPLEALKTLGCRMDDETINPENLQEVTEVLHGEAIGAQVLTVTYVDGSTTRTFWRDEDYQAGRDHETGAIFNGTAYEFFRRRIQPLGSGVRSLVRTLVETTPAAHEAALLTGMEKEMVQSEVAVRFSSRSDNIATDADVSLGMIQSVLNESFSGRIELESFELGTEENPENEALGVRLNGTLDNFLVEHASPADGSRVRHIFKQPGQQGLNAHAITLDDQGLPQGVQYSPAALLEELRSEGVKKVDILFAENLPEEDE